LLHGILLIGGPPIYKQRAKRKVNESEVLEHARFGATAPYQIELGVTSRSRM